MPARVFISVTQTLCALTSTATTDARGEERARNNNNIDINNVINGSKVARRFSCVCLRQRPVRATRAKESQGASGGQFDLAPLELLWPDMKQ